VYLNCTFLLACRLISLSLSLRAPAAVH
jgi:hypothetical protein